MLEGKCGIVIGATSDIGTTLIYNLVKQKVAKIAIHGRNSLSLNNLQKYLVEQNIETFTINTDLSKTENIILLSHFINDLPFQIDFFVYCPGIVGGEEPVGFLKYEDNFLAGMQINCYAPITLISMLKKKFSKKASIVFITSVSSTEPSRSNCTYSVSKCALATFSKSLALEFGPLDIRVNCVAPATVKTKMHEQFFDSNLELQEFFDKVDQEHPLGHSPTPEGVSNSIIFLLSDFSKDITGTELLVDCGAAYTMEIDSTSMEEEDD